MVKKSTICGLHRSLGGCGLGGCGLGGGGGGAGGARRSSRLAVQKLSSADIEAFRAANAAEFDELKGDLELAQARATKSGAKADALAAEIGLLQEKLRAVENENEKLKELAKEQKAELVAYQLAFGKQLANLKKSHGELARANGARKAANARRETARVEAKDGGGGGGGSGAAAGMDEGEDDPAPTDAQREWSRQRLAPLVRSLGKHPCRSSSSSKCLAAAATALLIYNHMFFYLTGQRDSECGCAGRQQERRLCWHAGASGVHQLRYRQGQVRGAARFRREARGVRRRPTGDTPPGEGSL